MRRWILVVTVLAAMSVPALGVRRMTPELLKQMMDAGRAARATDEEVMQELADVKLTARLTGRALQVVIAASPGPKTSQAIHAIADPSAFLDPYASELPVKAAPDFATQKAIIGRTINYVLHTLPALPNFFATRVTEHYVDSIQGMGELASEPRGGLLLAGTYSAPIGFRDGRETDTPGLVPTRVSGDKKGRDSGAKAVSPQSTIHGMSSWGEFGPILGIVLLDSAKGKLGWERWELEDGKAVAEFKFSVDRSLSHYALNYCCETTMLGGDESTRKGATERPAYHGSFEVDPETGTILRITIETDPGPGEPIQRASMMVEYGPVRIGSAEFFCPMRSVSISVSSHKYESHGALQISNVLQLNDVEFTGYHRFGATSKVIAGFTGSSGDAGGSADGVGHDSVAAGDGGVASPAAVADAAPAVGEPLQPAIVIDAGAVVEKEFQVHALNGLPSFAASRALSGGDEAGSGEAGGFTLKVSTRLVDVSLVADDKHGKPIADLKPEQIEIYDNGRKQQVSAFHHAAGQDDSGGGLTTAPAAVVSEWPDSFTNMAPAAGTKQDVPDLLILLLDESQLPMENLDRARTVMLRYLASSSASSRVGLYSIGGGGFRVVQEVTQNHDLIRSKLAAWKPRSATVVASLRNGSPFNGSDGPKDLNGANVGSAGAGDTIQINDPELSQLGYSPLRHALEGMTALARHFSSAPGHKSIVWISGDNVLLNWEQNPLQTDMEKGRLQQAAALQHTREVLNEAHIALYAVDASDSNVEGGVMDASNFGSNAEVTQSAIQNGPGAPRVYAPGQATTQLGQGFQAFASPIRQLAEGTGGRMLNRGGDLKAMLDGISRDAEGLYDVGFEPDTVADGKFHTLVVKVVGRKGVVLRYRTGYLYSATPVSTQERFKDAVWSPQDATGIGLTAQSDAPSDAGTGEKTVKLRISFPSLRLEQMDGKDGRWDDQIYMFVAVRDDATQTAEISGEVLKLALKQETYGSGIPEGIPYERAVEVKSKGASVRIIVVDGNSGKMGSVTLPGSALHL